MILAKIDDFKRRLHFVAYAYNQVFGKGSPHTETVLKDLAKFCRAHKTTFLPDARASAVLEGRREVWLRIVDNLNLTPDELYRLHAVKEMSPAKDE